MSMQWTSIALILCCLAALGWTCCTPDQWEGTQYTIAGYAGLFRRGLIREYNKAFYDATKKRSALFMTYINGDIEARLQYVIRYDDDGEGGMLYVEDLGKHKCWEKALEGSFRKACIPKDAHDYGSYYIGLEGGYQVSSYRVEGKRETSVLTVQPVKEGVCAPIGEFIIGRVYHYDVMTTVGFQDITPGIKNESVFKIPKDCKSWDEFELPMELSRSSYILAV